MINNFSKLNPEHRLFKQLSECKPIWWQNIVNKRDDFYIEVRKDNYIDVYFNGGAIMKLSYSNGFKGEIHFEYVPLKSQKNYVPFVFSDDNIKIATDKLAIGAIDNFSSVGISAFQKRIAKFFPANSEKGIQADFVLKNSAFIDTEFAYNTPGGIIRFDLVWIDLRTHKLYVVELKTIGDKRLYVNGNRQTDSVDDKIDLQLKKYRTFIRENTQNLHDHYERVFAVKKDLGILRGELKDLNSLDGYSFEERPILLIGDCTQAWINDNGVKLKCAIENIAYGCFYQGQGTRKFSIPSDSIRNKFVFKP